MLEVLKTPVLNIGTIFNMELEKFRLKLPLKSNIAEIATYIHSFILYLQSIDPVLVTTPVDIEIVK
jgi:hypothetical protein